MNRVEAGSCTGTTRYSRLSGSSLFGCVKYAIIQHLPPGQEFDTVA